MSRETARANIALEPCATWAHSEYSLECHESYAARLTGQDAAAPAGAKVLYDAWAVDFLWRTHDGLYDDWIRHGRATDMGHAEYQEGGVDRREPGRCPFTDVRAVWAFDPFSEYGLASFVEQVAAYNALDRESRELYPGQLTTGGYYKTIVSGAIQAFGWDMFLEAAAERAKMEKVFDRFFQRTLFHMRA